MRRSCLASFGLMMSLATAPSIALADVNTTTTDTTMGGQSVSVVPLSGTNGSVTRIDTDADNRVNVFDRDHGGDHDRDLSEHARNFDRDDRSHDQFADRDNRDHDRDMRQQTNVINRDDRDRDMRNHDRDSSRSGSVDRVVDRDINQQQQIEQGLKSGQLSDAEAARLERGEARIDRQESRALQDGNLSASEAARINAGQNAEERRISALELNGVTGSPSSRSTQRLEADIQRDINQEQRIDNGVDKGRLTAGEVGTLEGGQAGNDALQANAARNGFISTNEQQNIQAAENTQSADIKAANSTNTAVSTNTGSTPTVLGNTSNLNTSMGTAAMGNSTGFTSTTGTGAMGNSTGLNNTAGTVANTTTLASVNSGIGTGNVTTIPNVANAPATTHPAMAPIRPATSLAVHAGGRH